MVYVEAPMSVQCAMVRINVHVTRIFDPRSNKKFSTCKQHKQKHPLQYAFASRLAVYKMPGPYRARTRKIQHASDYLWRILETLMKSEFDEMPTRAMFFSRAKVLKGVRAVPQRSCVLEQSES